jgi:glutamate dehydrogenase/leucine dehydrogenase
MTTHGIYYYAVQSMFQDHVMSAPGETVAVTGLGSVYLPLVIRR